MKIYVLSKKIGKRYKPTGLVFFDLDKAEEAKTRWGKDYRVDAYKRFVR